MSMSTEQLQQAAKIFFQLLSKKIISAQDPVLAPYFEQDEVRDALRVLTDESRTRLIATADRLHLVARPEESIFSNSFSQLKLKNSDIESKRHFYLINLIIVLFLVEIDMPSTTNIRWEHSGVSYYLLEKRMTDILAKWKRLQEETEGRFSEEYGLAVIDMAELWQSIAVDGEDLHEDKLIGTKRTHIGLIHIAMRLLRDEQLVYIIADEKRVIPKIELYERLEAGYHQQARYEEMKELILSSLETGGMKHA